MNVMCLLISILNILNILLYNVFLSLKYWQYLNLNKIVIFSYILRKFL